MWQQAWRVSFACAQVVIGAKLINEFLLCTTACVGPSMIPTINPTESGTYCLVNKTAPFLGGFEAGDVVLAKSPDKSGKLIVKRVIATAGSTLHVPAPDDSGLGVHIQSVVDIPEDHVWLSGDNLPLSQDSRSYGPVPTRNLLGKLMVAVWPVEEAGFIHHKMPAGLARAYRLGTQQEPSL